MKNLARLRRPEAWPWWLVVALFAVLLVLIAASVATFGSVAEAHARTTLSVRSSVVFGGLSPQGVLPDNGTIAFTIYFHVEDPTSRDLTFFTVGYRVWLEDTPVEAGVKGITRTPTDIPVTNASGKYQFFPVFDGSKQTDPFPVPAYGNATMPFPLTLTRSSDAGRFAAIQNITAYSVAHLGGTSSMVWNVWVLVNLDIGGIPAPSSLSQAGYFTAISRVQFTEGVDYGEGAIVPGP
ncbi:MAG TPA: hypothetical protein VEY12_11255 [Thermoplasmata archaeon]|nr:hypothetical protein [Thermoplasmata archaeon]